MGGLEEATTAAVTGVQKLGMASPNGLRRNSPAESGLCGVLTFLSRVQGSHAPSRCRIHKGQMLRLNAFVSQLLLQEGLWCSSIYCPSNKKGVSKKTTACTPRTDNRPVADRSLFIPTKEKSEDIQQQRQQQHQQQQQQ